MCDEVFTEELNFFRIHQRPGPEPRTVSLKSDWSEECLNHFKGKQFSATER